MSEHIDCKKCCYRNICHVHWCKYDEDLLDDEVEFDE